MKNIVLNILICLSLCVFGCKSKYRKAADEIFAKSPSTINMNAGKESYSLAIPVGWTTENGSYKGINYYFLLAPKTTNDPNTNVNVITENMNMNDLKTYLAKSIESIKNSIPSAVVLEEGNISANGIQGAWYSYTIAPNDVKASLVSYIFPRNGVAYVITAGTQLADAKRYRQLFDSIAMSLKFDE